MDMPHKGHTTITIPKEEAAPIYELAKSLGCSAWQVVKASFEATPAAEIQRRVMALKEKKKNE